MLSEYEEILEEGFVSSQTEFIEKKDRLNDSRREKLSIEPKWYSFDVKSFQAGTKLELKGSAFVENGDLVRSSLARFEFYNNDNERIESKPEYLYKSKSVGYYNYLNPINNTFKIQFIAPEKTEVVKVGLQLWEKDAEVTIHPDVSVDQASSDEMKEKIRHFCSRVRETKPKEVVFMFSEPHSLMM